jgi:hypothetical protein
MIKRLINFSVVILILVITGSNVYAQTNQNPKSSSSKKKEILLSSFKNTDVGNPSIAGKVKLTDKGIDITAGGVDIWGVKDEFSFAYIERTGNFDFVSRIESLTSADLYTKAGLMAREDLTAGCRHIYFQVFPDNSARNNNNGGYEFQYRKIKDGEMKAIYPKSATGTPEFPVSFPETWVRLQRVGNNFTGYYSADGKTWKVYTSYTLDLPAKIFLGMAVTSHNPSKAVTAKFRHIRELKE